MPTVLAIDSSLSMSKVIATDNDGVSMSKLQLACICSKKVLDHMGKSNLEHVSAVTFSSNAEVVCDFTRNYNELRSSLKKIQIQDRCCFVNLVNYINEWIVEMWGGVEPCTIIVFTDGGISMQTKDSSSLSNNIFEFPASLHFICLDTYTNLQSSGYYDVLNALLKRNNNRGSTLPLFKPRLAMRDVVTCSLSSLGHFLDDEFSIFTVKLVCGNLSSKVALFPAPRLPPESSSHFRDEFHIVGFLNISDVGNPPVVSRHLLLPSNEDGDATETGDDSPLHPTFSVLLHGALKLENKVALVKLDENWFGIVCSYADGGKPKSNLVLSLLPIGSDSVPWLGDIRKLAPASVAPPTFKPGDSPAFPVQSKKGVKRSYAQPTVAWIRATGLQTDVQKILRSAKKLPEKSQAFYKDLNRLRRAALSFGFHELLEGISLLLERECTLLPGTAHPEAALQLSHASRELKTSISLDYNHTLEPLKTDFKFNR